MYSSLRYLSPIRNLLRVLSTERSPRQIAIAVALGMMIGLLPKGNLIAAGLTVCLFSLRINLGAGLTTAFLLTLVSSQLDPLTHGIGARMLNSPAIYRAVAGAYQQPIVPWTALNNTVVLGALTLGMALCYPVYHITEMTASNLRRQWQQRQGLGNSQQPNSVDVSERPLDVLRFEGHAEMLDPSVQPRPGAAR